MNWNKDFFNLIYQELFMKRDLDEINFDVDLITQITGIKNGGVVDFCCGIGDILSEFKRRGFQTNGVDLSREYVEKSKQINNKLGIVCDDALKVSFNKKFDLSINWFSSFGYFNDVENQKLLDNISNHTKDNGKFFLEIYNTYDILRNFKKILKYEKKFKNKNVGIIRTSDYCMRTRILKQNWLFNYDGDVFSFETKNKLYLIDEIIEMLRLSGFKNIEVYQRNKSGSPCETASMDSVRVIFVSEK